jgi:hypothetical protein
VYSSSSFLYAAMLSATFSFHTFFSSLLNSFHFTEMSAFNVELLIPGRSSSSCFLASLLKVYRIQTTQHRDQHIYTYKAVGVEFNLKRMKLDAGFLGLFGSAFSCFFFWRFSLVFCSGARECILDQN